MTGTMNRRSFLRGALGAAGGLTAVAAALSPLKDFDTSGMTLERFLQKHYKEMTPEDTRAGPRADPRRGRSALRAVRPDLSDVKPGDGVEFAYALNLGRCIGCRKCVHACVAENNQSRSRRRSSTSECSRCRAAAWTSNVGNHHGTSALKVPDEIHYYMPVQCHQCKPIRPASRSARSRRPGRRMTVVTVIDYDWCIGCRYCEAACPYWARRFNFAQAQDSQGARPEREDELPLQPPDGYSA
jgi:Fe-S-cluster-containing dehydrogenase component